MGKDKKQNQAQPLPVVAVYGTNRIGIKCPSCGFQTVITLDKPLAKQAKANCKKCNNSFLVKPNVRDDFRKSVNITGRIDRLPIEKSEGETTARMQIWDISRTGMSVVIDTSFLKAESLKVGEALHVRFDIPKRAGSVTLILKGVVKNISVLADAESRRLGLEFTDLDTDAGKEISIFLLE